MNDLSFINKFFPVIFLLTTYLFGCSELNRFLCFFHIVILMS